MEIEIEGQDTNKKKHEKESFRRVLNGWNTCLKNAQLYAEDHPNLEQSSQNAAGLLKEAFKSKFELTVSHAEGIFIIEDEPFIEESILMQDLMTRLEDIRISTVTFMPGITGEEFKKFTLNLIQIKKSGPLPQTGKHISLPHIRVILTIEDESAFDITKSKGQRAKDVVTLFEKWNKRTEEVISKLVDEQEFSPSSISEPLDKIIDMVQMDPEVFAITMYEPTGDLHFEHATRTMIISIYLGLRLNYDLGTLKSLATAALFHDIGRFLLPTEFKTNFHIRKSDEPFIQLHARDGAAFLAGVPGLPIMAARVALEHHIGFDGKGYPRFPSNHEPHYFSHIVGLASFVSWRTVSDSHYHKPISIYRLVRTIIRRAGSQFDPLLVKLLLPMIGFYPAGTKMILTSGDLAISLESNVRNIIRPGVAAKHGDEEATYHSLTEMHSSSDPHFLASFDRCIGFQPQFKKLLPLIPNRTELKTT